ncbi:hypothetical protein IC607_03205 [Cellulomonas sp. JH27-2]|uniref:DUF6314 family protein n=1 Tax=Cellulomonas sp. JH27-2 TaxID=2774139 RepID=UPI00177F0A53|nr:hypothetical protein [Cellulomonas sp. JH27-2]
MRDRFVGTWSMQRDVADALAGAEGVVDGVARTESLPDGGLAWVEEGTLTMGERSMPARRRLILRAGDDAVDVEFADGRPFFRLDPVDDTWSATHGCGADTYTVTGRFVGPDCFEETWHAVGPAKDYRLTTTYRRQGDASA